MIDRFLSTLTKIEINLENVIKIITFKGLVSVVNGGIVIGNNGSKGMSFGSIYSNYRTINDYNLKL